jgi:hypothetical protein
MRAEHCLILCLILPFVVTSQSAAQQPSIKRDLLPHATDAKSGSCAAYSTEKPPQFRVAKKNRNDGWQSVELFISVAPRDDTQDRLLTLGCHIGEIYAKAQILTVWILNDYRAAKHFNPQGEGNDRVTNSAFSGSYYFNRNTNDQSLTWLSEPGSHASTVKIELGPPPPVPSQ